MATDFATLALTWKPNQFLVLPAGYPAKAKAHLVSPAFAKTPDQVLDALKRIALAEPRTALLAEDRAKRHVSLVQKSKTFRFPDFIDAEAVPLSGGQTALAVYSRAKFGIRDFGVNRARVERWLAALKRDLG
jgi:uncharacterized protein (DUF1499 family)